MLNCFLVGCGGFLGAICRYLAGFIPINSHGFPFTTLLVNFAGAFLLGCFSYLPTMIPNFDPKISLFLTIGLCGGFTTFSTFSLDAIKLLENGKIGQGLTYIALSVGICLLAILIGRALLKWLLS